MRLAELQMRNVTEIGAELNIERSVQPHFLIDPFIGRLIGLVANRRNDGVGRD
ncbi:hypothetical protein D9M68_289790 [compost metagenome]